MKNKKLKKISMICNIISILLVIAFMIKTVADYTQYTTTFSSAPFSLWIGVNALFMMLPAIIVFAVGFIFKTRQR